MKMPSGRFYETSYRLAPGSDDWKVSLGRAGGGKKRPKEDSPGAGIRKEYLSHIMMPQSYHSMPTKETVIDSIGQPVQVYRTVCFQVLSVHTA